MQTAAMTANPRAVAASAKKTNVRWIVVAVLFFITIINYADRATISLAGPAMAKELGFDAVTMGYIFSAFGWAYVIFQLPGGWLLDKFGSKKVYAFSIFFWSRKPREWHDTPGSLQDFECQASRKSRSECRGDCDEI